MRYTRKKDEYKCRIADGCSVELWLENHGVDIYDPAELCLDCPFEKIINKLADYEDKEENRNDF